jgi:mono/diheme cytochrome c family protein
MRLLWIISFCTLVATATTDVGYAQNIEQRSVGQRSIGAQEYLNSCASCHGPGGKGDGPVASTLKHPPADLTKLSNANNGVFPLERTFQVIDGRLEVAAHGKRDMPVWGEVYKPAWDFGVITSPQYAKDLAESIARIRILALVEFISTLQTK